MTNLFTDYHFATADSATVGHERTLPDRLSDVKNVKDFGATGLGYPNDDHDAIMAAFNWTADPNRHTIFFPPGTYYVSEPIDLTPVSGPLHVFLDGVYGRSILVGNFDDYVIKKTGPANDKSFVENLIVVNNHATGGGVRLGGSVGAAMRNCIITANICVNTNGDDGGGGGGGGGTSLEFSLVNCHMSPGANTSGSIGLVTVCNGIIANCQIIGFEKGVITWGQQGGHIFQGCYFEGNGIAFRPGMLPDGTDQPDVGSTITGCHFKNNGTALYLLGSVAGGTGLYGNYIEADESVMVYGARPQYGIHCDVSGADFAGVLVEGQYEQAAIVASNFNHSIYTAVSAFNTSGFGGTAWDMSGVTNDTVFTGCNNPSSDTIFGISDLSVQFGGIIAASWVDGVIWEFGSGTAGSGYGSTTPGPDFGVGFYNNVPLTGGTGTGAVLSQIIVFGGEVVFVGAENQYLVDPPIDMYFPGGSGYTVGDVLSVNPSDIGDGSGTGFTLTVSVAQGSATVTTSNIAIASPNYDHTSNVVIEGITPSQYNGDYTGAIPLSAFSFMYGPVSNPGGNLTVAGTVNMNSVDRLTNTPNVKEGETHNVNDSSSSTWGDHTFTGGSTHAKIRWNGRYWTVVGK